MLRQILILLLFATASQSCITITKHIRFITPQQARPTKDVVDLAVAAGEFTKLVKLVTDLGLVDTLKNAEAVTIFAPNDEAFAKLPTGTLESLTPDQVCSIFQFLCNFKLWHQNKSEEKIEIST